MNNIIIRDTGKIIECNHGENLMTILRKSGVFVNNPCNGMGTCGKCKVKIIQGTVNEISQEEYKFLKKDEAENGIRLSCYINVNSDMEIETFQEVKKHKFLASGYIPNFEKDYFESGYGIAIDIGTTTVSSALVDLVTGSEVDSVSAINPQKQFGLDVLTRITYEYNNPDSGIKELQDSIVGLINAMICQLCHRVEVDKKEIIEIDVAANTTMAHMLLGVDARSIGKFPYTPVFIDAKEILAKDIGIKAADNTILYVLPHVSAFIGSDIVAGAYVSEISEEDGNILFIDIGTNGEIVLKTGDKLLCCSCAAGPALEGMNISSGMRAEDGAIEDVRILEHNVELTTIGGAKPVGICGSGILAVVKELLRVGIIKHTGVFIKKEEIKEDDYRNSLILLNGKKREFILDKDAGLIITQSDIRQVQLAKGAISSGFEALLRKAEIDMKDLSKVIIAGQFGANLPAESLIGIGILPNEVENKLKYIGNSSKTGAYMCLTSKKVKEKIEELAKKMEYVELSVVDNYENIFRECMNFPKLI